MMEYFPPPAAAGTAPGTFWRGLVPPPCKVTPPAGRAAGRTRPPRRRPRGDRRLHPPRVGCGTGAAPPRRGCRCPPLPPISPFRAPWDHTRHFLPGCGFRWRRLPPGWRGRGAPVSPQPCCPRGVSPIKTKPAPRRGHREQPVGDPSAGGSLRRVGGPGGTAVGTAPAVTADRGPRGAPAPTGTHRETGNPHTQREIPALRSPAPTESPDSSPARCPDGTFPVYKVPGPQGPPRWHRERRHPRGCPGWGVPCPSPRAPALPARPWRCRPGGARCPPTGPGERTGRSPGEG